MTVDESKIREAFEEKNWTEIKSQDSWSVFKIMSEFVTGYETLSKIGPCVAIFGSARTKPDNKYYKMAEETAYLLVKKGFGIITGLKHLHISKKSSTFAGQLSACTRVRISR